MSAVHYYFPFYSTACKDDEFWLWLGEPNAEWISLSRHCHVCVSRGWLSVLAEGINKNLTLPFSFDRRCMCSGSGYMTLGYAWINFFYQNKATKLNWIFMGKHLPWSAIICIDFCQHRDDGREDRKTVPAVISNHISFYSVSLMNCF